ncbi:Sel1-like repeat [Arabidopsis thaliana x Arabidopsis arenosa]|uniref:Sel1-like repeat n=1 Tax=Arabidopsis thaliana x Arabidopsis arenosa TaxID=1240361 RepID=A0A8T2A7Y7_9BRAS|nr:Sel1-like repeat [Arabidopsis thaliana x Arabidopsis arenosa]
MGKSIPVKTGLRGATAAVAGFIKSSKPIRPISSMDSPDKDSSATTTTSETSRRFVPLSSVVSDCAKRWFKDTLEEAKAGNITMQVLLGQMYYSGYGVPKDAKKVSSLSLPFNLFFSKFRVFTSLVDLII